MKVLILGGTTFFGKEIVRHFTEQGCEVATFTRGNVSPTDIHPKWRLNGQRQSLDDLNKAASFADWDVLIDNLAYSGSDVSLALKAFPLVKQSR